MNDIEAARLAKAIKKSSDLRLPADPNAALSAMQNALTGAQKPADSDLSVSGYHDTNLRSEGYSAKFADYREEVTFRQYVRDFYKAGASWAETCRFFNIKWDELRRILNA